MQNKLPKKPVDYRRGTYYWTAKEQAFRIIRQLAIKKLYIQTFGCQMNVHDSEQIVALLKTHGYAETDQASKADVIPSTRAASGKKPRRRFTACWGASRY